MELLANHLQVFISLIAILGAAGVALLCDLLKSNNEQLREVNTELRVRVEEARRDRTPAQIRTVVPRPSLASVPSAAEPKIEAAEPAPVEIEHRPMRKAAAAPVIEEPQKHSAGASLPEARALAREYMGRAAARVHPATEAPIPEAAAPQEAAKDGRKDWSKLLKPRGDQPHTAEVIPFETIQHTNLELTAPAGFHEGMALARLLNVDKAVRGLVMVIGINDLASRRGNRGQLGAEALTASIAEHLKSILEPGDFACKTSDDEFLLICGSERGAQAQRRLGRIAESLWDFQLRTIGTAGILFSWGGIEGKGEPFADVLATAAERMRETRRGRRTLTLETRRRVAV